MKRPTFVSNKVAGLQDLNLTIIDLTFFFSSLSKKDFLISCALSISFAVNGMHITLQHFCISSMVSPASLSLNSVTSMRKLERRLYCLFLSDIISNFLNVFSCEWVLNSSSWKKLFEGLTDNKVLDWILEVFTHFICYWPIYSTWDWSSNNYHKKSMWVNDLKNKNTFWFTE